MQVAIDIETTSKNPLIAEVVTVQVTNERGTVLVRPSDTVAWEWLRNLWLDPTVEKCFQNGGPYDIKILERYFGSIVGYAWDTLLAEHLLHESTHYNLELLRGIYTANGVYERELRRWKEEEITIPNGVVNRKVKTKVPNGFTKKGKPKFRTETEEVLVERTKKVKRGDVIDGYGDVPPEILYPYGVMDSQTTFLVQKGQEQKLSERKKTLLQTVILPMQLALKDMEREGILVDVARIPEIRNHYVLQTEELARKVHKEADEEFKVSSPLEVRRVLFEELGLPHPPIKSKLTGQVGTGKKSLDWLSSHADHPVLKALQDWRASNQLLNNFLGKPNAKGEILKGLMTNITEAGRIHTTFRMTLETGRQASSPNLQNLPKTIKGPIRELFIAAPGNVLVEADFSQIELRVAAYEAKDTQLISMLESGADIHTHFARRLFPFEPDLTDKEWSGKYDDYRTMAKVFTFGRLYGQGEEGMSLAFNISTEEALRFQDVYAELFPGMAEWWEKVKSIVRSGEPLETVFGRTRTFPAFQKFANINWRGRAGLFSHMEREGLDFLPQGTAADCLNLATGNVKMVVDKFKLPVWLRLVVHDSLTVETPFEYKEQAAAIMKAEMEGVGERFGWKLPVECKWGRTWAGKGGKL